MRFVSLVLVLVAVAMASASESSDTKGRRHFDASEAPVLFEDFVKTHNKQYKDVADREVHYKAFIANLEKINKLNEQNPTATYGINKFADFTEEDRKQMFGTHKVKP